MHNASRLAALFSLPALLLALVSLAAWLALGSDQTGMGPMRLAALPSSAGQSSPYSFDPPPPTELEKISPLQARLRNALIPYAPSARGLAHAYRETGETPAAALTCLTQAIYYEAGREAEVGKRAVAQVVVNRASSAPFPNTICGVVQQGASRPGCQFTFMCDGSLSRTPNPALWSEARRVAETVLKGETEPSVGGATHYHADYVFPTWAPTMAKVIQIGAHIFYRWRSASDRAPTPLIQAPLPPPVNAPLEGSPADARHPDTPLPGPESNAGSESTTSGSPSEKFSRTEPAVIAEPRKTQAPPPAPSSPPVQAPSRPEAHPRRAIPERSLRDGPF